MRVIAGKARRIQLKSMEGMNTRPTTDRIKETLFNMLSQDIYGCHFLDLFSGSGAIAIEALSRGAAYAVLVEQNATKALEIADYSYVLSTGKIVSSGEGRSLLTDASVRSAYLG